MSKRLTHEFVKEQFEKESYKLLTKKYKNNTQKLEYICPNGHVHSISWSKWCQGQRCPCFAGRPPINIDLIRKVFEKENYKLLTNYYKNCYQKLEYVCSKGHRGNITWNHWQQRKRCFYCAIDKVAGENRLDIEFIRSKFAREGYVLLIGKYINARQKLNYVCPKGHRHNITWDKWQQGQRCPECIGIISKGEVEVRDFVKSLGIKVLPNNRNQIFNTETGNGLELDIFMPTLNKAVEYNGEYWHKNRKKDIVKQKLCESKGIDLLTIWENRWKTEKNICKDKIKEFIFK